MTTLMIMKEQLRKFDKKERREHIIILMMMKKEQLTEIQEKGNKAICDNMDVEKKKKRKKKRGKQKEETKHDNPTDGEEED